MHMSLGVLQISSTLQNPGTVNSLLLGQTIICCFRHRLVCDYMTSRGGSKIKFMKQAQIKKIYLYKPFLLCVAGRAGRGFAFCFVSLQGHLRQFFLFPCTASKCRTCKMCSVLYAQQHVFHAQQHVFLSQLLMFHAQQHVFSCRLLSLVRIFAYTEEFSCSPPTFVMITLTLLGESHVNTCTLLKEMEGYLLKGLGARSYVRNQTLINECSGYLFNVDLQLIFSAN